MVRRLPLTRFFFPRPSPHLSDHRRPHGDRRRQPRCYGTGPYPTVLHIHGCRFAVHGEIFNVDNLLLAAAGYGVLMVNFRGSSGYGDAHAEMLIGDWGRYDLADVLQAVDVAVGQGLADSTRVASFGLSSGGYLTSAAHPQRPIPFRHLRVPRVGLDRHARLRQARVGRRLHGQQPGHGPDSMEPYTRMSPATYAARCSAPLLILEHQDDLRYPTFQGDVLYNELKLAGKVIATFLPPRRPTRTVRRRPRFACSTCRGDPRLDGPLAEADRYLSDPRFRPRRSGPGRTRPPGRAGCRCGTRCESRCA